MLRLRCNRTTTGRGAGGLHAVEDFADPKMVIVKDLVAPILT